MPVYARPDRPQFAIDQFDAVVPVTPSDTTDLAEGKTSALWVGTAGSLKITCIRPDNTRTTATLPGVQNGTLLQGRVIRVWATPDSGSAASDIVALY